MKKNFIIKNVLSTGVVFMIVSGVFSPAFAETHGEKATNNTSIKAARGDITTPELKAEKKKHDEILAKIENSRIIENKEYLGKLSELNNKAKRFTDTNSAEQKKIDKRLIEVKEKYKLDDQKITDKLIQNDKEYRKNVKNLENNAKELEEKYTIKLNKINEHIKKLQEEMISNPTTAQQDKLDRLQIEKNSLTFQYNNDQNVINKKKEQLKLNANKATTDLNNEKTKLKNRYEKDTFTLNEQKKSQIALLQERLAAVETNKKKVEDDHSKAVKEFKRQIDEENARYAKVTGKDSLEIKPFSTVTNIK